jgi:hypothetical protein
MKSTPQEISVALDRHYVSIGVLFVTDEQRAMDLPRMQRYLESFDGNEITPFGTARARMF